MEAVQDVVVLTDAYTKNKEAHSVYNTCMRINVTMAQHGRQQISDQPKAGLTNNLVKQVQDPHRSKWLSKDEFRKNIYTTLACYFCY